MPRGRTMAPAVNDHPDTNNAPGDKDQPLLELDGEWLGDVHEPKDPAAEKQHEHDSPAMTLLLSITKAAADAVPGLSPRTSHKSRLRRPRAGSVGAFSRVSASGSGNGSGNGSGRSSYASPPGEFYRLPWYRRPLPSPRPGSAGSVLEAERRKSTSCASMRGTRPAGVREDPLAGIGIANRRASSPPPHPLVGDAFAVPANLTVEAAPTPDLPPAVGHKQMLEASTLDVVAAAAAAEKVARAEVTAITGAAAIATPAANSMATDRGVDDQDQLAPPEDDSVAEDTHSLNSEEVATLKAEIDRLKREMATMAAAATAAATAATSSPEKSTTTSPRAIGNVPASTRSAHLSLRISSSSDSTTSPHRSGGHSKPGGRALRADDSWLQNRRISNDSLSNGLEGSAKAGSVLPTLDSDDSAEAGRKASRCANAKTPPYRESVAACEGPSPASGDKNSDAKDSSTAEEPLSHAEGANDDGGSQSGSRSGSPRENDDARPFHVFFPVQDPPETEAPVPKPPNGEAPPEAPPADSAKEDLPHADGHTNGAKPQQSERSDEAPVVYAQVPGSVKSSRPAGTESRSTRRREVKSQEQVWRWVLAQRTQNVSVRQALISHGLPPSERRRIWAAWAALALPDNCPLRKGKATLDPNAQGAIPSIIAHDVQRTKISHPLFTAGTGMDMLRRVLLRCAELGAVKDAGYIQGMNYLAGFLLITIADAILAEREGDGSVGSGERTVRARGGAAQSEAVTEGVTLPAEVQVAAAKEAMRGRNAESEPSPLEMDLIENECVQTMLGVISLQGGVLSRDLWGLHSNTELVEELLSRHCPDIVDHLRSVNLELIVLTPRWFICIYAGSLASQAAVARIWDLFLWHGRRGPAVLVWVALGVLHGCRRHIFESKSLPTTVKAVRRYAEGCKTFDDLVRHAPIGLNQVVAAWEEKGSNRRIAALDGDGVLPDKVVGGLVREMTGEMMISIPPSEFASPPKHHRRSMSGLAAVTTTPAGFGIQFPSTPGRTPTPLSSPRSPFPEWAANIFRSSTGGGERPMDLDRSSVDWRDEREQSSAMSPRFEGHSSRGPDGRPRSLRRAASTSWW